MPFVVFEARHVVFADVATESLAQLVLQAFKAVVRSPIPCSIGLQIKVVLVFLLDRRALSGKLFRVDVSEIAEHVFRGILGLERTVADFLMRGRIEVLVSPRVNILPSFTWPVFWIASSLSSIFRSLENSAQRIDIELVDSGLQDSLLRDSALVESIAAFE